MKPPSTHGSERRYTVELPNLTTLDYQLTPLSVSDGKSVCVRVRYSHYHSGCHSYEIVEDMLNIVSAYIGGNYWGIREQETVGEEGKSSRLDRLRLGIVCLSPQLMRPIESCPDVCFLMLVEMQINEGQSCGRMYFHEFFLEKTNETCFNREISCDGCAYF